MKLYHFSRHAYTSAYSVIAKTREDAIAAVKKYCEKKDEERRRNSGWNHPYYKNEFARIMENPEANITEYAVGVVLETGAD